MNRLNNNKLLSGTLCIKAILNGNPFYYGKLLMSYQPLKPPPGIISAWSNLNYKLKKTAYTMCPHVLLDPTTNTGGELKVPFFFPTNYLDLGGVFIEDADIGNLNILDLNELKHCNMPITISDGVDVTIYAWMENVEVEGPTGDNLPGLVAQAKKVTAEKMDSSKPISQAATNVARISKVLEKVPLLSPYAKATTMAAKTTSTIASLLGYSRPTCVADPCVNTVNTTGTYLAPTNTTVSCQKLTLDCKQELTIDSRPYGLHGVDEMSINYIASKPTFADQFTWAYMASGLLRTIRVNPGIYVSDTISSVEWFVPTAVAGTTMFFHNWTGSLEYTFQIVASQFHKGRLQVDFDPNSNFAVFEPNTHYSEIIDIAETREFKITIGNHNPLPWLQPWRPGTEVFGSSTALAIPNFDPGILSVRVLNDLVVPNTDADVDTDITINVWVNAGEDFQVMNPTGDMLAISPLVSQSAEALMEEADEHGELVDIKHSGGTDSQLNNIYMGEAVGSLRTLLKRYYPYFADGISTEDGDINALKTTLPMYPMSWGYVTPNALHETALSDGYNYVHPSPLPYIMAAFAGVRGGIRYKAVVSSNYDGAAISICRMTEEEGIIRRKIAFAKSTTNDIAHINLSMFDEHANDGMAIGGYAPQKFLDVEIPYLLDNNFIPCKFPDSLVALGAYDCMFQVKYYDVVSAENPQPFYKLYYSTAEDFTCLFFCGWAPICRQVVTPAPKTYTPPP